MPTAPGTPVLGSRTLARIEREGIVEHAAHPAWQAIIGILFVSDVTQFSVALTIAGALAGGAIVSFLGVVAARTRRRESIVMPPSHCGVCASPIRPYDNVPVLSWLVLRGRCRDCGTRLPVRDFVFEICGAVLGALVVSRLLR